MVPDSPDVPAFLPQSQNKGGGRARGRLAVVPFKTPDHNAEVTKVFRAVGDEVAERIT